MTQHEVHRPRRQPRRDRGARHQNAEGDGHPVGGGVQRRRCRRPPCRRGGHRRSDRPRTRAPELPRHRGGGERRPANRRAGGAPGLRIPCREPGFRRGAAARRHHLHRSARGRHPHHGRQDRREVGGVRLRRPGRARHRPPGSDRRRTDLGGRRHRLPDPGQALGGRRRQGVCAASTPRPTCPPRWSRPAASRPPRSGTTRCSWSGSCCGPGTSRYRCSPTATAPCCISASASAACSAAIRRSSRRRPHRCSTRPPGRGSGRRPATPPAASTTSAPERWSSSSPPPTPTSSSSWR